MRTYKIALIFIIALIVGGTIGFFSTGFLTASSVTKEATFYYEPSSPDPIESLNISCDIGKINVQYNSSNTPYYAKIDVDIEIAGLFMQGKSYTDFFTEESNWWNPTTGTFSLKVLPDIWFDPSYWFKSYNITINLILRADIVYDLIAKSSTGSVKMTTKDGLILNNTILESATGSIELFSDTNVEFQGDVKLHASTGNLIFKALDNSTFSESLTLSSSTGYVIFNSDSTTFLKGIQLETSTGFIKIYMDNCTLGSDLIVKVSTGEITLDIEDMVYTNDCIIDLETSTGDIDVDILHNNDLDANITANFQTSTGRIDVVYRDYNVTDGFKFTSYTSTGGIDYTYLLAEATRVGDVLTSVNYNDSLVETYTFTCITSTGGIKVDARTAV